MDQLVIPQGCVIQGEKLSIRHEGDIVIRSQMSLLSIKSLHGNLHYAPPGEQSTCAHLGAEEGELRLDARAFQGDLLTGRTLVLNCGNLLISQAMQASESLLLEGESLEVPECRGGELVIHLSGSAQAQTIEAEGPLELVVHSGTVGHIRARRVLISCAGRFEADRITASEGVEIRSGHITVKMVDAPSFQAAPSVRGIVMLSTAEDVRAEGVRGFILPTEFKMLSEQSGLLALASSGEPAPSSRPTRSAEQPAVRPAPREQAPSPAPSAALAEVPAAEPAADDLDLADFEEEEPLQGQERLTEGRHSEAQDPQAMDPYRIDTADLSYLEQVESGHLPEPADAGGLDLEAEPAWHLDGEAAPVFDEISAEPASFAQGEDADLAIDPDSFEEPASIHSQPTLAASAPADPEEVFTGEEDLPEQVFEPADSSSAEIEEEGLAGDGDFSNEPAQPPADEFALDFSVSEERDAAGEELPETFDQSFYTMAMPAFSPAEPAGEHSSQPLPDPASEGGADPAAPEEAEEFHAEEPTSAPEEDAAAELPLVDSFDDADLGPELPAAPAMDAFDSAELVPEPLIDSSFASTGLEELAPPVDIADFQDPDFPVQSAPLPPPVPPPVPPPLSLGGLPGSAMPAEPSQDEEELPSPSQAQLRKEDLLVDLLGNIMDDIKSHFPDDNYPKFIGQIETYLQERRFPILRKARNREAVLSSFDRLDHPEISKLARLFYKQMANFFGDEM